MIELSPEDVTAPAGWTEEQVLGLIETTLSYVRRVAPPIDSLTGDAQVVATDLVKKLVALNGTLSVTGGVLEYSSGPFSHKTQNETTQIYRALRRLCGLSSSVIRATTLRTTSLRSCHHCGFEYGTCVCVHLPYSITLD